MAAASYLRGRFVCATHKTWDTFTDRDGNDVKAGESLVIHIYTEADNDLCAVMPGKDQTVGECLALVRDLGFGVAVEVISGPERYGKYRGIYGVQRLEPAASGK